MVMDYCFKVRWAEWNGMYRDDVRRFIKGMKGSFATRVAGSSDLYQVNQRKPPYHGVNFIIAHDGFTLRDHTILSLDECPFLTYLFCNLELWFGRGNWQMKNFHLALMISQLDAKNSRTILELIKFRHTHHACVLKHENFLSKIDNWDNPESKLHDSVSGQDVYAAFNPHDYFVTVEKTMADTNMESPDDFVKEGVSETYNVAPFSSIPLKSM
ncbi:hypothetical protein HID58_095661 [Brassica napus]|uniref:Uncharacterized protein n=1 Tax=Brassica napus TaxID=3708 RepID=A0ABQ7X2Y2_BRANA|nr:hypothetical protein HID58_095661 [Brassica napus]